MRLDSLELYAQAQLRLRAGDKVGAIKYLRQAQQADPSGYLHLEMAKSAHPGQPDGAGHGRGPSGGGA